MLIILLAVIAIPLKTALKQVASEAVARGVIEKVVKELIPATDLISQQVMVGRNGVAVRLVSAKNVGSERLKKAEREIEDRSGRKVDFSVETIASQSDLAKIVQEMDRPASPAPALLPPAASAPKPLETIRAGLMERAKPAVEAIWPPENPVDSFDITFSASGITMSVRYRGIEKLAPVSLSILARELRNRLQAPDLLLDAQQIKPKGRGER